MNQPNDLAIAPNGTLYASDPNWGAKTGQLWRIDPDGTTTRLAADMGTTNGVEVSPRRQAVVRERKCAAQCVGVRHPAGRTAWPTSGCCGSFLITALTACAVMRTATCTSRAMAKAPWSVLSPEGEVLREINVLGARPSNLCFGGPDGRTVYVTEVEHRRLGAVPCGNTGRGLDPLGALGTAGAAVHSSMLWPSGFGDVNLERAIGPYACENEVLPAQRLPGLKTRVHVVNQQREMVALGMAECTG